MLMTVNQQMLLKPPSAIAGSSHPQIFRASATVEPKIVPTYANNLELTLHFCQYNGGHGANLNRNNNTNLF
jgi:hypothetical protein